LRAGTRCVGRGQAEHVRPWTCRTTLGGTKAAGLDCRRGRRGPKVRQERGRADGSIARSAPCGASAPRPREGHTLKCAQVSAASPGSRGLQAPQRCASRRIRRSGTSLGAAICWSSSLRQPSGATLIASAAAMVPIRKRHCRTGRGLEDCPRPRPSLPPLHVGTTRRHARSQAAVLLVVGDHLHLGRGRRGRVELVAEPLRHDPAGQLRRDHPLPKAEDLAVVRQDRSMENGSTATAARMPRTLLAEMASPSPVPPNSTARSISPPGQRPRRPLATPEPVGRCAASQKGRA
jgi:hypothetical protein